MANSADNAPVSDTETAEKPVREQLKKASIAGSNAEAGPSAPGPDPEAEEPKTNGDAAEDGGKLQRKRSHEESEGEQTAGRRSTERATQHTRKRSRDSTADEDELNHEHRKVSGEKTRDGNESAEPNTNGKRSIDLERPGTPKAAIEVTAEEVASPKTKRSRIHSSTIGEPSDSSDPKATAEPASSAETANAKEKESAASKIPPSSGFANTSAASPFGILEGSKSPSASSDTLQTSSSAFAASGFSSLAASATSGFGAIGKSTGGFGAGGGFATGAKSPAGAADSDKGSEKPAESSSGSTFGGALGQKSAFATPTPTLGFGSGASGFGKLGASPGGFGGAPSTSPFAGTAGGGGLTSFASGRPSAPLSGPSLKPAKAFGAPPDEEDENGEDGEDDDKAAGFKNPLNHEDEKQDERFYEQQLETGEEEEEIAYSCRAKLYAFAALDEGKKEWRERGLGTLRLNVKRPSEDDPDEKLKARFLMRAEGSHRVVLNTPVKKELKFGAANGGPPQGGFMFFKGTIDGNTSLETLQLKLRQNIGLELYEKIVELQEQL